MPDFFRIEEVLLIRYGDINFHSGYAISNLEVSKTDQLRKGNQVVIAESSNNDTLVSINKPISYSSVRDYVKSTFKDIVSNIALFSTHSLRAGGASAAANAGVADRLFQRHGRWNRGVARIFP